MLLKDAQPTSEILPVNAPAAAISVTPTPSGTQVILVATAEASEPFRPNPVVISLGLPISAFKTQVGGQPALLQPGTLQAGWGLCQHCLNLVFTADAALGRCPAGGQHVTRGGYALQAGDGGPGVEAGWRRCGKCQSLTFTGNGGGVCAAGGAHETGASASYVLTQGNAGRGQQAGWRRCRKCQGLALNMGRPRGACPAGGQHDPTDSAPYAVTTQAIVRPTRPVRKPQLFLLESYQLSNFSGDLLRDKLLATMPSMLPFQTITCRVLTRMHTTQQEATSSTVLDAQSAQAAQSFNEQLRAASSARDEADAYTTVLQENSAGQVEAGFFGDVSFQSQHNVAGATNNVRKELANAVDLTLDKQVSLANQARQESVRVASAESKIETTNETETIVETTNPTDKVQNYGIYQLKQEHVSILSLVDAEVMFLNGEAKDTQKVPLFRLDELLEQVIEQPEARALIKAHVRDCLSRVRDHNDQEQSIIQDDANQPGGFIINKKLRSSYELRHTDGAVRQVLSVPGVILSGTTKQLKKPGATVVASIV
jgi:hypothetical protein